VRLGLSIGSVRQEKASALDADRARPTPFDEVLDAVAEHAGVTGLRAALGRDAAGRCQRRLRGWRRSLGAVAREFWERTGVRPRISVIPYNSIDPDADPFARARRCAPSSEFVRRYRHHWLSYPPRYSGEAT
jgi:hypothetical protein